MNKNMTFWERTTLPHVLIFFYDLLKNEWQLIEIYIKIYYEKNLIYLDIHVNYH